MYIIGRGGFGKVWKVRLKKTNEFFALKEMSKLKIIDRRSEESIMSERNLLSTLNHSFIVNMYFAFQDFYNLYLVMDLLTGGDLRYHIAHKKVFTEQETKFFISNMILSLEYIHSKNIIHRDIKPENLVLETNGYLRITDFGVAKINEKDNSSETSGTPGYMAPEVILVLNHTFVSDFFALGVIGYEFMLGYRPYLGGSRKEIKQLIINKQAKLHQDEIPEGWSLEAADFINKLLKRKAQNRLGANGINELKNHIWMKDVDWEKLEKKKITPPYVPKYLENFDQKYCEGEDEVGEETVGRYQLYVQSDLYPDVFKNYTYCNLSYISNYHIKKLKKFKENNRKIKDIVEQNIRNALKEQSKEEKEIKNKNESTIKDNKNDNNIENKNNKIINKRKHRSKSVEEIKKHNNSGGNEKPINNEENKEETIKIENKNMKNNSIININNNYNNINNDYYTINVNKMNSKSKKRILKQQKIKQIIKNFNEKIIYNNYINLHINNFSTNNKLMNNNSKVESFSINKKEKNINEYSNITKKIKSKMDQKSLARSKKITIVKSNSMKMIPNNSNNIVNYFLSLNKSKNTNTNNKNQVNKNIKNKFKNYKNKSDIISSKNEKNSPKIKNLKKMQKGNLLMDIINNNNFKSVKINKITYEKNKTGKNKTYGNRIVKCNSSRGFFNTEKISTVKKKSNIKKNRTHISMQNISNSNVFNYNLSENYKTINAQYNYSKTKSKKSIRLINHKNLKTFLTNNFGTVTNKKRREIKYINSNKIP